MADQFVDTHCHIQFSDYQLDPEEVIKSAQDVGVTRLMCVGCTLEDSKLAVAMAAQHDNIWATIGLHPHEGAVYVNDDQALQEFRDLATKPKVVAVGETGLDYFYNHSNHDDQKKLLRFQLSLAAEYDLPVIFHIRDAWADFWPIYDEFKPRGVVHCFSASTKELDQILKRGLMVGLNGIMTFTKDPANLEAAKAVPLDRIVLETDAPFLTPTPYRGTICEPKHVRTTAEFLSSLRGESLTEFAAATTHNARALFNLN